MYLQRPLDPGEIMNIKAENEASRGNHDRALNLYRSVREISSVLPDARLRAFYGIVQMDFELQRYQECVAAADTALEMPFTSEAWIHPQVLFRKGQALVKLGRRDEAKTAFTKIAKYDDYDFQSSLERRVDDELRKLGAD
jgi:tetratricopeptide (TPR) repeat protein